MLKYSLRLISMAVVMTIALSGIWAMPALTQTFSLWSDESMSSCSAYMYQYETFTVYVFLEPGPDGAFAAEYKLVVPDSIISISDEPNSFISTAGTIGTPVGPPGISAPFTSCQNSITWVYKHTFILMGQRDPSYITMYPNDDSGFMGVATCEEPMRPMVDASLYNFFGVNSSCTGKPAPFLEDAYAQSCDEVIAVFDYNVDNFYSPDYFQTHFKVYLEGSPPDTLDVTSGEWLDEENMSCLLQLEDCMQVDSTYKVVASTICSCCGDCATSRQTFIYEPISTQLQQYSVELLDRAVELRWVLSSIDPGTEFHISRREALEPLSSIGKIEGEIGKLIYSFEDHTISGGKKYTYRIEYAKDSKRVLLFETGAIETVPVPVCLSQNHPNPFNPSTSIEFFIPTAGDVSLKVFDIIGRLIKVLVEQNLNPGSHSVTWNGLDSRGITVPSGVYFYRLTTGKDTISKKMVLLR